MTFSGDIYPELLDFLHNQVSFGLKNMKLNKKVFSTRISRL